MSVLMDAKSDKPPNALRAAGVRIPLCTVLTNYMLELLECYIWRRERDSNPRMF